MESTTNCMGIKLYGEFSFWPTLAYRVLLPHLLFPSMCHHDTGLFRWCSISTSPRMERDGIYNSVGLDTLGTGSKTNNDREDETGKVPAFW